jgi:hypothetical protein
MMSITSVAINKRCLPVQQPTQQTLLESISTAAEWNDDGTIRAGYPVHKPPRLRAMDTPDGCHKQALVHLNALASGLLDTTAGQQTQPQDAAGDDSELTNLTLNCHFTRGLTSTQAPTLALKQPRHMSNQTPTDLPGWKEQYTDIQGACCSCSLSTCIRSYARH